MLSEKLFIIAILFSSSVITFILAILIIRRRNTVGVLADYFTCVLAAVTIYSFGYAMELLNNTLPGVMFWLRVEHIGIQTISVFWLLFALCLTGKEKWITPKRILILFIMPVINYLSLLTNDWFHLFYRNPHLVTSGDFSTFHFAKGIIYWVNIIYINLLILIAAVLFLFMLIRSAPPYRNQASMFFFSSLIPWVGMGLYVFGYSPYNLDLSPIALSISSLMFAVGVLGFHVLDVVPLAHDMIFEGMSDGALVLDNKNRIVDLNSSLPLVIPEVQKSSIGSSALEILKLYPELVHNLKENSLQPTEIKINSPKGECYYESKISPVIDRQKRVAGKILSLHDVTEMKRLMQQLQDLATLDGLTGVYNRRYFNELANREILRATRYDDMLSLIMLDLDHFKNVNDRDGHAAGDAVLISVAKLCYGMIRRTDIFARYGGEEFVILLPQTNLKTAMMIAERLRKAIEEMKVRYKNQVISITASFGVISIDSKTDISLDEMLSQVDTAVYRAKGKGRNCVCGN